MPSAVRPQLVAVAALILSGSACATVGSVRSRPLEEGDVRRYDGTLTHVAYASRNAVAATQLQILEVDSLSPDTWYVLATRVYGSSKGEIVRVVCRALAPDVVEVHIITARRDLLDGRREWAPTLFAQIGLELEALRPPDGA